MPFQKFGTSAVSLDELYTIAETRAILKIGSTKCWALIREKSLDAVRLGNRCTRVTGASLSALITAPGVRMVVAPIGLVNLGALTGA